MKFRPSSTSLMVGQSGEVMELGQDVRSCSLLFDSTHFCSQVQMKELITFILAKITLLYRTLNPTELLSMVAWKCGVSFVVCVCLNLPAGSQSHPALSVLLRSKHSLLLDMLPRTALPIFPSAACLHNS